MPQAISTLRSPKGNTRRCLNRSGRRMAAAESTARIRATPSMDRALLTCPARGSLLIGSRRSWASSISHIKPSYGSSFSSGDEDVLPGEVIRLDRAFLRDGSAPEGGGNWDGSGDEADCLRLVYRSKLEYASPFRKDSRKSKGPGIPAVFARSPGFDSISFSRRRRRWVSAPMRVVFPRPSGPISAVLPIIGILQV